MVQVNPCYHIYSTGSELTEGTSDDGNGPALARKLTEIGCQIRGIHILPDDPDLILTELKNRLQETGISGLVITGGLGPTSDDHTLNVLARLSGRDIIEDDESLRRLEIFLRKKKRSDREKGMIRRQVRTLQGSRRLINERGLAPGLVLEQENDCQEVIRIIALPGVPREMNHMLETGLIPLIRQWHSPENRPRRDFYLYNVPESRFESLLTDETVTGRISSSFRLGVTSHRGYLKVFIEDASEQFLEQCLEQLRFRFHQQLLEEKVEHALQSHCTTRGIRIGVAESCTGGMIAARLTDQAGSSRYFRGGIVAYSNDLKMKLLNVPGPTLREFGAVSEECARSMARGALDALDADFTLSVTGIAGPGGGTPEKPVGTVFVAVGDRSGSGAAFRLDLLSDRDGVREYTTNLALFRLFEYVSAL